MTNSLPLRLKLFEALVEIIIIKYTEANMFYRPGAYADKEEEKWVG